MRDRPGHEWREARWVEMGNGQWRRVGGNWERGPYGDRDRDGIPDRYDHYRAHAHGPYGDRDGDGIPNRYDHYRAHAHGPYGDREGDGVLNKDDRFPNDPNRSSSGAMQNPGARPG